MRIDAYDNNQDILNFYRSVDLPYTSKGFPILKPLIHIDDNINTQPFNYALTSNNKDCYIHYYIQDYMFNRIWNAPDKYLEIIKRYKGMFQPDFSMYLDMPKPLQIFNHYRNMWIAAYYQSKGIEVIPSATWAGEDTFSFCFNGMPTNSIIAISSIGCMMSRESEDAFYKGLTKCIEILKPIKILLRSSIKAKYEIEKYINSFNISVIQIDYVA